MAEPPRCERLSWDSDFWGFPIARVSLEVADRATIDTIDGWCARERIRCLYVLSSLDPSTLRAIEAAGSLDVDRRLTLVHPDPKAARSPADAVRACRPDDVARLGAIAAVSHTDTRFYADPGFTDERCDALYRTWIENSCNGFADVVLVADVEGAPAGYISGHLRSEGEHRIASIGLIAVDERARGRGLGADLTRAALAWAAEQGASRMEVVTQGRNQGARRLYERCGFTVSDERAWFHRWYEPEP